MSLTMHRARILLGVGITFSCIGCTPPSNQTLPHFNLVAKATVESQAKGPEQEKLAALFKDATSEIQGLRGKGLEHEAQIDPEVCKKLKGTLNEIADVAGIRAVGALALDITEDDYVRQSAWSLLTRHENTMDDLPILCQVYQRSIHAKVSKELGQRRGWIEPWQFRLRLGRYVAYYCGIRDIDKAQGAMSLSSQETDPKKWLVSVLKYGIAHEKDKAKVSLMARCLHANSSV